MAASRARMMPVGVENVRSKSSRNCRRADAWSSGPVSDPGSSPATSTARNAATGTFLP